MATFSTPFDINLRIVQVSIIFFAYIAFIPSLRTIIPNVRYITFNDYLLYSNLLGCLGVLFDSFLEYRFGVETSGGDSLYPLWTPS